MSAVLTRPRKPDARVPVISSGGLMTPMWYEYYTRMEDYAASLEARIKALEP